MMQFSEFKQWYMDTHPGSIPVKAEGIISPYPNWYRRGLFLMFVAATIISGAHTIPAVYASLDAHFWAEGIRLLVSVFGFLAVDLALFLAAYASLVMGNANSAVWLIRVIFFIALMSNLNSVFIAGQAGAPIPTLVVGVALGFGIPWVAMKAGDLYAHMNVEENRLRDELEEEYSEAVRDFDRTVLQQYGTYRAKMEKKVSIGISSGISSGIPNGNGIPELSSGNSNGIPDGNSGSNGNSKRNQNAAEAVKEYLLAHAGEELNALEVARVLNVGKSTVYNVMNAMKSEQPNEQQ